MVCTNLILPNTVRAPGDYRFGMTISRAASVGYKDKYSNSSVPYILKDLGTKTMNTKKDSKGSVAEVASGFRAGKASNHNEQVTVGIMHSFLPDHLFYKYQVLNNGRDISPLDGGINDINGKTVALFEIKTPEFVNDNRLICNLRKMAALKIAKNVTGCKAFYVFNVPNTGVMVIEIDVLLAELASKPYDIDRLHFNEKKRVLNDWGFKVHLNCFTSVRLLQSILNN